MVIIGRRGARGEAPKNTAGGFAYALEKGVRHFELDLRRQYPHGDTRRFNPAHMR